MRITLSCIIYRSLRYTWWLAFLFFWLFPCLLRVSHASSTWVSLFFHPEGASSTCKHSFPEILGSRTEWIMNVLSCPSLGEVLAEPTRRPCHCFLVIYESLALPQTPPKFLKRMVAFQELGVLKNTLFICSRVTWESLRHQTLWRVIFQQGKPHTRPDYMWFWNRSVMIVPRSSQ